MNDAEQADVVHMSDEDAAAISARLDESAARIAETVRLVRTTGSMQFQGNVVEMLAVLVVLRYLDNEGGETSILTVDLCDDESLPREPKAEAVRQWLLS